MPHRAPARPLIRAAALASATSVALLVGMTSPAFADDIRNCDTFATWAEADAYWKAQGRPAVMDDDEDGIPCESRPGAPTGGSTTPEEPAEEPTTEPTRPTTPPTTTPPVHHEDEEDDQGGHPGDDEGHHDDPHSDAPHSDDDGWTDHGTGYQGGNSGSGSSGTDGSAQPLVWITPGTTDRDCPDFPTQAEAQAVLSADPSDPERLDADGDGIACEDSFGTEGRQVAVFPLGGVATGGTGTR
ncbi:excalibur calcium-binding domain-containing protein [Pseudonocardia pini]|uniref:excalibur calcium-binding domain-containing protein n=1 Tax=Pseudonocardia pini TaxID=2758030 RepID=UPI0015EFE355|nr:excalibur calcium-binding domain-containing protein [Pseudonocardia pini]